MASYLEYLQAAMDQAQYEQMEDGEWFASIPGFDGLWVTGSSETEARKELMDALDGWIYIHVMAGKNSTPTVGGIRLFSTPQRVEHD